MTDKNIWIASGDGDIERVKELLATGVALNAQDEFGYTPLAAAVSYNHIPLVVFLISQGADVNIRDAEGNAPLHYVETVEVARILLDNDADPFATNAEGKTPAQVAFEEARAEVAQLCQSVTGEPEPQPIDFDEHFTHMLNE